MKLIISTKTFAPLLVSLIGVETVWLVEWKSRRRINRLRGLINHLGFLGPFFVLALWFFSGCQSGFITQFSVEGIWALYYKQDLQTTVRDFTMVIRLWQFTDNCPQITSNYPWITDICPWLKFITLASWTIVSITDNFCL